MIGSKRTRRAWKHRKPMCFCWYCLSSKAKKHDAPRTTVKRAALHEETKDLTDNP